MTKFKMSRKNRFFLLIKDICDGRRKQTWQDVTDIWQRCHEYLRRPATSNQQLRYLCQNQIFSAFMMDPLWHSLIWSAFKSYKSCLWSMKHFYFWTSQIFVMCLKYLYNICDVLRRQEIFIIDGKKGISATFFSCLWFEAKKWMRGR